MNKITKVMITSVITNTFLSLFKIIMGSILYSSALLADGVHSMSDLLTDFFAIIGDKWARKPADLKHPYGHGKLEYVTSIGISIIILMLGFSIIYNISTSEVIKSSILVSIVSLMTIILKYFLAIYIIKKGKDYNNNILIASGNESKADVISSLVVLVSAIVMQFSNYIPILKYADKIAGLIVGCLIIKTGFVIFKENLSTIIGEQEIDSEEVNTIKNILETNENICSIDELVVLKYGHCFEVSIEVSMDSNYTLLISHNIIDSIEKEIKSKVPKVAYIKTHVNPYNKE